MAILQYAVITGIGELKPAIDMGWKTELDLLMMVVAIATGSRNG